MTLREKPASLAFRLAHPRTTVRWRLTLVYGGLFLAAGVALLAITYALVSHATVTHGGLSQRAIAALPSAHVRRGHEHPSKAAINDRIGTALPQLRKLLSTPAGEAVLRFVGSNQRITDLHELVIESGIALAIMTLVSGLLGWVVAAPRRGSDHERRLTLSVGFRRLVRACAPAKTSRFVGSFT